MLLAGYGLVALAYGIWLLTRMRPMAAWEHLWPAYMVACYEEITPDRWPRFASWGGAYLHCVPVVMGLGMVVLVILRTIRNRAAPDRITCALMFLPLYFAVGCTFLFRTPSNFFAHTWMAWPAIALLGEVRFRLARYLIILALLPVVAWQTVEWLDTWKVEKKWQAESMRLPNGQSLWFHGPEAVRIGNLARLLQEEPAPLAEGARRRLVVLGAGGGVLHFFNADRVGRHWWYLPQFVRPWEAAQVVDDLSRHELLLQYFLYSEPVPRVPADQVSLSMPVDPALGHDLVARMELVEWAPGLGYLFRIPSQPNKR
jgi:hypothetical protein